MFKKGITIAGVDMHVVKQQHIIYRMMRRKQSN